MKNWKWSIGLIVLLGFTSAGAKAQPFSVEDSLASGWTIRSNWEQRRSIAVGASPYHLFRSPIFTYQQNEVNGTYYYTGSWDQGVSYLTFTLEPRLNIYQGLRNFSVSLNAPLTLSSSLIIDGTSTFDDGFDGIDEWAFGHATASALVQFNVGKGAKLGAGEGKGFFVGAGYLMLFSPILYNSVSWEEEAVPGHKPWGVPVVRGGVVFRNNWSIYPTIGVNPKKVIYRNYYAGKTEVISRTYLLLTLQFNITEWSRNRNNQ